jgi:ABC-type proline/glycine betaine transport system permease subunit
MKPLDRLIAYTSLGFLIGGFLAWAGDCDLLRVLLWATFFAITFGVPVLITLAHEERTRRELRRQESEWRSRRDREWSETS